jgi:hypothetical protein
MQRLYTIWFSPSALCNVAATGHTGSQGGFISDYLWLPEKKLFYVLLCNIPKPIKEIRQKVFDCLFH